MFHSSFSGIEDVSVQLTSPESASFIKPGIEVVLRCHVDGSGDIHYEWFRYVFNYYSFPFSADRVGFHFTVFSRNAERLTKSSKIDIKKKKLHIKSVDPSVNGVYRCTARNEAGSKQSVKNFALAVPG